MVKKFHTAAAVTHKRPHVFVFSLFPIFTITAAIAKAQYGLVALNTLFYPTLALTIQNVDVTLADFTECETVSMLGLLHEQNSL